MKFLVLSLSVIILLTSNVYANGTDQNLDTDYLYFPGQAQEFADMLNFLQMSHDVSYTLSGNLVSDNCVVMMNGQQIAGVMGANVAMSFQNNATKLGALVQGGSINRDCPKYSKMDIKQKSLVWVLILTSMAHFESQCRTQVAAKGPNGTAYGYYQLHKGKETSYDKTGLCEKNSSGDIQKASKCALGMLDGQFRARQGELFNNKSYWDVLRPNGHAQKAGVIRGALRGSALCSDRSI